MNHLEEENHLGLAFLPGFFREFLSEEDSPLTLEKNCLAALTLQPLLLENSLEAHSLKTSYKSCSH